MNIENELAGMTGERLEGALAILDHISRPLTPREIEGALRLHGVPKPRAVVLASSLRKLGIIAIVGGEHG